MSQPDEEMPITCHVCNARVRTSDAHIVPHWNRVFTALPGENCRDTERRVAKIMADPRESPGELCPGSGAIIVRSKQEQPNTR